MSVLSIGGLALIVVIVLAYFVPTVVAFTRGVSNSGSVFVLNLFLGWTVVGWVVALAMATRSTEPRTRM
ncbi:superinfection immunity protein [Streptomyces sp. ITFR-6]|uniref:superinfection immunity protein n=1 Tax=Streptomyces sp. ITFR-6 TaxID=3075197 RepID=UPI00288B968D|nr:superinfection immunity protein [Streptomyces sp. ITFR-6]WNI31520.1 superinfection immunity protein [Streptomyces sp. ITFR-6]